jgi:hypothetical protein
MAGTAMTKKQAQKKLRTVAKEEGGQMSKTGLFVDLPNNPYAVGWGAVLARNCKNWVLVSIPR